MRASVTYQISGDEEGVICKVYTCTSIVWVSTKRRHG